MSRQEEIRDLLGEVLPRLEALKDSALAEIEEAQKEAQKNVTRHGQAAEELAQVEAELSRLTAERENLPTRSYRAHMDENWQLEDELKVLYKNVKAIYHGSGVRSQRNASTRRRGVA